MHGCNLTPLLAFMGHDGVTPMPSTHLTPSSNTRPTPQQNIRPRILLVDVINVSEFKKNYTVSREKGIPFILAITWPNVDQF